MASKELNAFLTMWGVELDGQRIVAPELTLERLTEFMEQIPMELAEELVDKVDATFRQRDIPDSDPLHRLHFKYNQLVHSYLWEPGLSEDIRKLLFRYREALGERWGTYPSAILPYRKRKWRQYLDLASTSDCMRCGDFRTGYCCKGCGAYVCPEDFDHRNHYVDCGFYLYIVEDRKQHGANSF